MKGDFFERNLFFISFCVSLLIHSMILIIPFSLKHDRDVKNLKIFVVDILKKSKSNEVGKTSDAINYDGIVNDELERKMKEIITPVGNRNIPSINYSFDREQYDAELLKILHEKMKIDDYLEREGVSGAYLFQIEIEGSGRVRSVKTLRKDGSDKLEDYVKKRLYGITFPPHGEFLLTVKVNMVFQLE